MLQVHTLPLGDYQTNCYIVHQQDDSRCCVIDPGYQPEDILNFLQAHNLTLEAILLTHGHFDHVGGVKTLAAETDCKVYLCPEDLTMPPMMTAGSLYYTDAYEDGDRITQAGISFEVLHTPGHTPGSVCLIAENALFSGDTLFASSCGRTDLPGGNSVQMRDSLKRLSQLEGNYFVYPGHGCSSTLLEEKRYNSYLRSTL